MPSSCFRAQPHAKRADNLRHGFNAKQQVDRPSGANCIAQYPRERAWSNAQ
jgi:hypothetical protein